MFWHSGKSQPNRKALPHSWTCFHFMMQLKMHHWGWGREDQTMSCARAQVKLETHIAFTVKNNVLVLVKGRKDIGYHVGGWGEGRLPCLIDGSWQANACIHFIFKSSNHKFPTFHWKFKYTTDKINKLTSHVILLTVLLMREDHTSIWTDQIDVFNVVSCVTGGYLVGCSGQDSVC